MTTERDLVYENPLIGRYASRTMAERWGAQRKFSTWRRLWLYLAEAEAELGLMKDDGVTPRISGDQLQAMREHLDDIQFSVAASYERKFRHDVMAHVHTFGDCCPIAKDVIHLGATSCYVTDNTDLILLKESMIDLAGKLAAVIHQLSVFAEKWKSEPTLGFTHFQPAQLTTVGKRCCLWISDLVLDLHELEHRIATLTFRGVKGTTGTQASFLALFQGDHGKVRQLDELVTQKAGFEKKTIISGQTYTRKFDSMVLDSLSGIGQSLHKWGNDLRLLAHKQEIDEPFEQDQIGSSAMAYKRNPMRAERICSLSRVLMGFPAMAANTTATQWFERTLDDSAARRVYLPQAFLAADACLQIALNISSGLVVNKEIIHRNLMEYLPYMMTENVMMAAVAKGEDRQEIHEIIRQFSHQVTAGIKTGEMTSAFLVELLKKDKHFQGINIDAEMQPSRFVGRSAEQVEEFLLQEVAPIRLRYHDLLDQKGILKV
ncbi:MAG: adenylosuccinate lyase [Zavarzinella sp.]